MNDQLPPNPEAPATEVVSPGPVTGATTSFASGPLAGAAAATAKPLPARARWARVGLLGIGAAALIAAASLAFGSTATPTGTLAAGATGSDSTTGSNGILDLHGGPGGRGGPGFGGITITAISGSSISLETEDGWTRTITVDADTTYTRAGEDIALGDLAVGDTIGFRQTQEDDGTFTIDAVAVILPHVGGEVTAIDGSTVTVEQRDGTAATINVGSDANVVVNGDAAALADIEVGMVLVAEGTENSDGSLDATRVRAGDPGLRGDGFGGHGFKGPFFGGDDDSNPDATTAPEATGSAT